MASHAMDSEFLERCRTGNTENIEEIVEEFAWRDGDMSLSSQVFSQYSVWKNGIGDEDRIGRFLANVLHKGPFSQRPALRSAVIAGGLAVACHEGRVDFMKKMIESGVLSLHHHIEFAQSLLRNAARHGRREMCQMLMGFGISPYTRPITCNAFSAALEMDHHQIVEDMWTHEGTADDKEVRQATKDRALRRAAVYGSLDSIKMLRNHGAAIDGQSPAGATALILACMNGKESIVKALCEMGADPTIHTWSSCPSAPLAESHVARPVILSVVTDAAAYEFTPDVEVRIMPFEASFSRMDVKGYTALHYAVAGSLSAEAVSSIIACGGDPLDRASSLVNGTFWQAKTPLEIALEKGQRRVIIAMLQELLARCVRRTTYLKKIGMLLLHPRGLLSANQIPEEIAQEKFVQQLKIEVESLAHWKRKAGAELDFLLSQDARLVTRPCSLDKYPTPVWWVT